MDNFKTYYNKLNAQQRQAVDTTDGPVLVLAGPGTGKTELLSVRAANIIHKKQALPENILILTYTNSAAKEMKKRLGKMLGPHGYEIETGTFHSFANSIILESEEAANYIQDKIEITDVEKIRALEYILDHTDGIDAIRPFKAPYFYRAAIETRISELKREGITHEFFEQYIENLKPDGVYIEEKHIPRIKALAKIYKLYEFYKAGQSKDIFDERGRYDFDDMIIIALEALKKEADLKKQIKSQYTYIMVDEYQDTNGAQLELLFATLSSKKANICCVGDDDQSIYRFQGASVGNFKLLKSHFPEIKIVSLKDNYRSTKEIIRLSDKIISQLPSDERTEAKELIPRRDFKRKEINFRQFTTEEEELIFICDRIEDIIATSDEFSAEEKSRPYNNIAVLLRKREDILKIIDMFQKRGIPYATDGKEDISSEKRVRQMLDVLQLAHIKDAADYSEKDAAFYRVITGDYFDIPMTDILKIMGRVNLKKLAYKDKARVKRLEFSQVTFFGEFLNSFYVENIKSNTPPEINETKKLHIVKELKLKAPDKLHKAGWAIMRLLKNAENSPTHALLMHFIEDVGLYKYILEEYNANKILRIRDLRALTSFVNMIKLADLSRPGLSLSDFLEEIETRKQHNMALRGNLVTATQDGVRVYTAHGTKGLEFHTVIIPFCLQDKNWPIRPRGELIPLPPDMFPAKEKVKDKTYIKRLNLYDETRLFYVASSRAKSNIIYTASPTQNTVTSSYIENIGLDTEKAQGETQEESLMVKSIKLTDKKDPFIGTEGVLKDLIGDLSLNPTSLNTYIKCKRKFLYNNVLMLPAKKNKSLIFGSCVHKALEDTYRFYREKGEFPDFNFFKKSFIQELRFQGVEKSIFIHCERKLNDVKGWFKKESKKPIKPIGLEQKLSITLGDNVLFTGKYDKSEFENGKDKTIRVVDYKTGTPDSHFKSIEKCTDLNSDECDGYLRQLVCYKLLYDGAKRQNKGNRVISGRLVFIEPIKNDSPKYGLKKDEFKNIDVTIAEDISRQLEDIIIDCAKKIRNLKFEKLPEPDKDKCGTQKNQKCDYYDICWG